MTQETTHTPEPWETDYRKDSDGMYSQEIFDTAGKTIAYMSWYPIRKGNRTFTNRTENAARIVACVNACAGMADPAAEIAALRARVAELEKEAGNE